MATASDSPLRGRCMRQMCTGMRGLPLIASLTVAALLSTASPVAAAPADTETSTTESTEVAPETVTTLPDTPETPPISPFAQRYDSLAGAMVQFYAARSGLSFESYLAANGAQVAEMVGIASTGLTFQAGAGVDQFELQLRGAGATLEVAGLSSFDDLLAEFRAKATSMDGQVALLGASFASSLTTLHQPDLAMPQLPQLPAVSPESLAFGLFVNESLTNLIANHPDVFAQVGQSGLGSPQALAAWRSSMLQAGTVVGSDLSRLPMPCVGELLQSMASGSSPASGTDCGACAVAGAYLHNQTANLLDPTANTTLGTPTAGPGALQPWLADALEASNPSLATGLADVFSPSATLAGCTTASTATSSALSALLPDVFDNLSTGMPTVSLPGGFDSLPGTPAAPQPVPATPAPSVPVSVPALPGGFGSLAPADD